MDASKELNSFMAQVPPQYCPRCGTEIMPQQRFCPTCGLPRALQNVELAAPPPPGAPVFAGGPQGPQAPVSQPQVQPDFLVASSSPSRKRKLGRNGIVLLLVALLLVIIAAGYGVLQALGVGRPSQAPIARTNINTTVTYAGAEITVLNVQQAQNFLDDPSSTSNGMLRLQIQARNTFSQPLTLAYSSIAHLIQPNGQAGTVVYASSNPTIAPGAMQSTNVDFALPTTTRVDQLTLQLGSANEAQIAIPLNAHADMSKYAPKTVKLANNLTYLNTSWTLLNATSQFSFDGRQAGKGMRYVTLAFSVDNPLMESVIFGSPYTYMRLKTNASAAAPMSATLPVSLDAGVSGKMGEATFQVPQNSSTLALALNAPDGSGFDSATTTFQV